MLKPTDPTAHPTGPGDEKPIGDLVHRLVEDGKAYAKAEVNLAKTVASSKVRGLGMPAALIGAALLFGIAAVCAFAFGIVLALAKFVGPLTAGLITLLIFAGIAGGLGWFAVTKARKAMQ